MTRVSPFMPGIANPVLVPDRSHLSSGLGPITVSGLVAHRSREVSPQEEYPIHSLQAAPAHHQQNASQV